jgi:hypothetical protein
MTVALFFLRQVRRSQTAATDQKRMGDRAVYCARLESVCAERHPGFESPPIRAAKAFTVG